ncbi:hypothetical protein H0R92_08810 [Treponema sp. OMZ 840]|uniref:hypothetical protein n=1 Tax=Treponema sp. OMZ 840 TaxID=244313 RepID=UPI003D9276A9
MKNCYALKSHYSNDYLTIEKELDDGFVVRIVRDKDGFEEVVTDFISKILFESCIRTGYLTKIEVPQAAAVSA